MDLILPAAMNFERYAPFGVYGSNLPRELRLNRWVRPKKTGELHWSSDVSWTIRSTFLTEIRLKRATPFSRSGAQSTKPQWLLCLRFPRWNAERTNRKNMKKGYLDRMDKPALIRLRARSSSSQHDVQNLVSTVCRTINR